MVHEPIASSNPDLEHEIAQRIVAHPLQRITFAEYMDLCLYHPCYGYYVTKGIGVEGDFFTSPYLGRDFGELLAEQFAQMWTELNCPLPFTLVEMGAGQGLLVQDILRYLHRHHFPCFDAIEYFIVEKSSTRIAEQQQQFQPLVQSGGRLRWCSWEDIASSSIVGVFFSNELVDAFPVHQVIIHAGKLKEVYVTLAFEDKRKGQDPILPVFKDVVGELSTPQLATYFDLIGVALRPEIYPDGYRSEVNLAALDWVNTVADRLQRGYVLTIDYGYPAHRYYSPGRSQGTLQCYYQHAHHSNPYINIGRQDITAHVDFTALERQGEQCGLQTIGFTQQGLFLMALGLGDRLAALSDPATTLGWSMNDILRRRDALHLLMNPLGLGSFGVLVQSKGISSRGLLQGFSIPGV